MAACCDALRQHRLGPREVVLLVFDGCLKALHALRVDRVLDLEAGALGIFVDTSFEERLGMCHPVLIVVGVIRRELGVHLSGARKVLHLRGEGGR